MMRLSGRVAAGWALSFPVGGVLSVWAIEKHHLDWVGAGAVGLGLAAGGLLGLPIAYLVGRGLDSWSFGRARHWMLLGLAFGFGFVAAMGASFRPLTFDVVETVPDVADALHNLVLGLWTGGVLGLGFRFRGSPPVSKFAVRNPEPPPDVRKTLGMAAGVGVGSTLGIIIGDRIYGGLSLQASLQYGVGIAAAMAVALPVWWTVGQRLGPWLHGRTRGGILLGLAAGVALIFSMWGWWNSQGVDLPGVLSGFEHLLPGLVWGLWSGLLAGTALGLRSVAGSDAPASGRIG